MQLELYEAYGKAKTQGEIGQLAKAGAAPAAAAAAGGGGKGVGGLHIFQALMYLRKVCRGSGWESVAETVSDFWRRLLAQVCNHPALALQPGTPEHSNVVAQLSRKNSSLHDLAHSCKLRALRQLLLDCGIGVKTPSEWKSDEC